LRYFNPVGHIHKEFKEDPNGIPNNIFPYLLKVHSQELPSLTIFGSDYDTRDGTCSRDFISVIDLANAHLVCSNFIFNNKVGLKIYNVGTGKDTTVLELINIFEKINNTKINFKFGERRQGDIKTSFSNVDLIKNDTNWRAKYSIEDCVKLE
jgi:UDP-glucose 4-epimerase